MSLEDMNYYGKIFSDKDKIAKEIEVYLVNLNLSMKKANDNLDEYWDIAASNNDNEHMQIINKLTTDFGIVKRLIGSKQIGIIKELEDLKKMNKIDDMQEISKSINHITDTLENISQYCVSTFKEQEKIIDDDKAYQTHISPESKKQLINVCKTVKSKARTHGGNLELDIGNKGQYDKYLRDVAKKFDDAVQGEEYQKNYIHVRGNIENIQFAGEKTGKSSMFQTPHERGQWIDAKTAAKTLKLTSGISEVLYNRNSKGMSYSANAAKHAKSQIDNLKAGKYIAFDTETLFDRNQGEFGLSEIGFSIGGKSMVVLCRLTDPQQKLLKDLIQEGKRYASQGEDAVKNWWRRLGQEDYTAKLALERMMGKYNINMSDKDLSKQLGVTAFSNDSAISLNEFGSAFVPKISDFTRMMENVNKLSSNGLPTQTEAANAFVKYCDEYVGTNGGAIVSYNGTSFDADAISKALGTNVKDNEHFQKLMDSHHIDVYQLVISLESAILKRNDGEILISKKAQDLASYLNDQEVKKILNSFNYHSSGVDIKILRSLLRSLINKPEVLDTIEKITKAEDPKFKQIALKKGMIFTTQKGYQKQKIGEFSAKLDADGNIMVDYTKNWGRNGKDRDAKPGYRDDEDYLMIKGGLYCVDQYIKNANNYQAILTDMITGRKIVIQDSSLEGLGVKLGNTMDKQVDAKDVNKIMLDQLQKYVSKDSFTFEKAEDLFNGAQGDRQRLRAHSWHEVLGGLDKQYANTDQMKMINAVKAIFDGLENAKVSRQEKVAAFNYAMSSISAAPDIDTFIRRNIFFTKKTGANTTMQADKRTIIANIKANRARFLPGEADKIISEINRQPGTSAQWYNLFKEIITAGIDPDEIFPDAEKTASTMLKNITKTGVHNIQTLLHDAPKRMLISDKRYTKEQAAKMRSIGRMMWDQNGKDRIQMMGLNPNITGNGDKTKDDIIKSISSDRSIGAQFTRIVNSLSGTGVQMNVQYHKGSNTVELSFYTNADERNHTNTKISLPISINGTGRYMNRTVSNALVPIKVGNEIKFSDAFTEAWNSFADVIIDSDGRFKYEHFLYEGSGGQKALLRKLRQTFEDELASVSAISPSSVSKELRDSTRGGGTPEEVISRTSQNFFLKLNTSIINTFGTKQTRESSYQRQRASQFLMTYINLKTAKDKSGRMDSLAEEWLNSAEASKFFEKDNLSNISDLFRSSVIRAALRSNMSASQEDQFIGGHAKTVGAEQYIAWQSGNSGANRTINQEVAQYLPREQSAQSDIEQRMKLDQAQELNKRFENVVHQQVQTTDFMENIVKKTEGYKDRGEYFYFESTDDAYIKVWNAMRKFLKAGGSLSAASDVQRQEQFQLFNGSVPSTIKRGESIFVTRDVAKLSTSYRDRQLSAEFEDIPTFLLQFLKTSKVGDKPVKLEKWEQLLKKHGRIDANDSRGIYISLGGKRFYEDTPILSMEKLSNTKARFAYQETVKLNSGVKATSLGSKGAAVEIDIDSTNPYMRLFAYKLQEANPGLVSADLKTSAINIKGDINMIGAMSIPTVGIYRSDARKALKDDRYFAQEFSSKIASMALMAKLRGDISLDTVQNKINQTFGLTRDQDKIVRVENGMLIPTADAGEKLIEGVYYGKRLQLIDEIGNGIFGADWGKYQHLASGVFNIFNEYAHYQDIGAEIDEDIDFDRVSKFKIAPKDEIAIKRAMQMSGMSKNDINLLYNSMVRTSKYSGLQKALWTVTNNIDKISIEDQRSNVIIGRGQVIKSDNHLNLNELIGHFNESWDAPNSVSELKKFMEQFYVGSVKDAKGGYVYLDITEGAGSNGEGINIGGKLITKIAIPVIDPDLITKDNINGSSINEVFLSINRLLNVAAKDNSTADSLKEAVGDYFLTLNNMTSRKGFLWESAFVSKQGSSAWKKATPYFNESLLDSRTGVLDNAAMLNPESIRKMLSASLDDTYSKQKVENFVDNYSKLVKLSQRMGVDESIVNPNLGTSNKNNYLMWYDNALKLQNSILGAIMNKITIESIDKNVETGKLSFKMKDGNIMSEEDMWNNPYLDYIVRRYPIVAEGALLAVRMYAYDKVKEDTGWVGRGAMELLNGDFDGDALQFWHAASGIKDTDSEKSQKIEKLIKQWTKYQDYRAILRHKLESEFQVTSSGVGKKAPDERDRNIIQLMSKMNKVPLGSFSLKATAVRNAMQEVRSNVNWETNESLGVSSQYTVVSGLLHYLEQESISSKKIGDLLQAGLSDQEVVNLIQGIQHISDEFNKWAMDSNSNQDKDLEHLDKIKDLLIQNGLMDATTLDIQGKVGAEIVSQLGGNLLKYLEKSGEGVDRNSPYGAYERAQTFVRDLISNPNELEKVSRIVLGDSITDAALEKGTESLASLFAGMVGGQLDADGNIIYNPEEVNSGVIKQPAQVSWKIFVNAVLSENEEFRRSGLIKGKSIFQSIYDDRFMSGKAHGEIGTVDQIWESIRRYRAYEAERQDELRRAYPDLFTGGENLLSLNQAQQLKVEVDKLLNGNSHLTLDDISALSNITLDNANGKHDYFSNSQLLENVISSSQFSNLLKKGSGLKSAGQEQYQNFIEELLSNNRDKTSPMYRDVFKTEYGQLMHSALQDLAFGGSLFGDSTNSQQQFNRMESLFGPGSQKHQKDLITRLAPKINDELNIKYGKSAAAELSLGMRFGDKQFTGTIDSLRWNGKELSLFDYKNKKFGSNEDVVFQTALTSEMLRQQLIGMSQASDALDYFKSNFGENFGSFGLSEAQTDDDIKNSEAFKAFATISSAMKTGGNDKFWDYVRLGQVDINPANGSRSVRNISRIDPSILQNLMTMASHGVGVPEDVISYIGSLIGPSGVRKTEFGDNIGANPGVIAAKTIWANGGSQTTSANQEEADALKILNGAGDNILGVRDQNSNLLKNGYANGVLNNVVYGLGNQVIQDSLNAGGSDNNLNELRQKSIGNDYTSLLNEELNLVNQLNKAYEKYDAAQIKGDAAQVGRGFDAIRSIKAQYEAVSEARKKLEKEVDSDKKTDSQLQKEREAISGQESIAEQDKQKTVRIGRDIEQIKSAQDERSILELTKQYGATETERLKASKQINLLDAQETTIKNDLKNQYGLKDQEIAQKIEGEKSPEDAKILAAEQYSSFSKRAIQARRMAEKLRGRVGENDETYLYYMNQADSYQNAANNIAQKGNLSDTAKNDFAQQQRAEELLSGQRKTLRGGLSDTLNQSLGYFLRFGVIQKAITSVVKTVTDAVKIGVQLNGVMTNIRVATGQSRDEAQGLMITYSDMGKQLGVTTAEVANSADSWLRQGYQISEANKLTESSIKLSKLGMIESGKATSYLTSTIKGFSLEASDASKVVDKLTTLDMKYATSAGDIAEAISRVASVAKSANMDLDSTAAMLTTIMDITQQDAGSTGTALRSMISRYGSVNATSYQQSLTGEDIEGVNDVEKVLKTIGINIRGSGGNMKAFDEVMDEVAEQWIDLSDVQKNAIATAMAGTRQRNAFITLAENWNEVEKAEEISKNSEGQADQKYKAYEESTAYQIAGLKAAFEKYAQQINTNAFFKNSVAITKWLVEGLPEVISLLGILVGIISNIRVSKSGDQMKGFGARTLVGIRGFRTGASREDQIQSFGKKFTWFSKKTQSTQDVQSDANSESQSIPQVVQTAKKGKKGKNKPAQSTSAINPNDSKNLEKTADSTKGTKESIDKINKKLEGTDSDAAQRLNTRMAIQNSAYAVGSVLVGQLASGNSNTTDSVVSRLQKPFGNSKLKQNERTTLKDTNADAADTLISGIGTVAGGAAGGQIAGTAYGSTAGPWGALIGAIVGMGVGSIAKLVKHYEETQRQDRVKVANKVLDSMSGIKDSIQSLGNIGRISSSEYTSEDWQIIKDTVNGFKTAFQSEYSVFTDLEGNTHSLQERFTELYDESTEYSKALDDLMQGTTESREIFAALSAAVLEQEAYATYASGETSRFELSEQLNDEKYTKYVYEYQKQLEENGDGQSAKALQIAKEYSDKYDGEDINTGVRTREALLAQLDQYKDDLNSKLMEAQVYSSDVATMSSVEISNANLNRVIYQIAKEWKDKYRVSDVFDVSGQISDDAKNDIIAYLRSESTGAYKSLFGSDTKFLGGVMNDSANNRRAALMSKYNMNSYTDLVNLATVYGEVDDADRDEILNLDDSMIKKFAYSLNMTSDELINTGDKFNWLSESIITSTSSVNDLCQQFTSLNEVQNTLVENGYLTSETMTSIIKQYPYLLVGNESSQNAISSDNILSNLISMMVGGNSQSLEAFAGLTATSNETDEAVWKLFRSYYNDDALTEMGITQEELQKINQSKFLSDGDTKRILMSNSGAWKAWTDMIAETSGVMDQMTGLRDSIIKYETKVIDNEITGLNSIKETLNQINDQREEELKLIKSKLNLENAQKEKKRVYRAGIGWTYESDQSAVQEAQKTVEEAEQEKTGKDIQYQIDILEKEKSILNDFVQDENWNNIESAVSDFKDAFSNYSGSIYTILYETFSQGKWEDSLKNAISDSIKGTEEVWLRQRSDAIEDYYAAIQSANQAYNAYDEEKAINAVKKTALYEQWIDKVGEVQNKAKNLKNTWYVGSEELNDNKINLNGAKDKDQGQDFYDAISIDGSNATELVQKIGSFAGAGDTEGMMGGKSLGEQVADPFSKYGQYAYQQIDKYNPEKNGYDFTESNLSNVRQLAQKQQDGSIVYLGGSINPETGSRLGGESFLIQRDLSGNMKYYKKSKFDTDVARPSTTNATGTTNFSGGTTLINELGTEAIVTPGGTITSLPSHSGIVPADLTRSLYDLGSIAPSLIKVLGPSMATTTNANNRVEDNSMNVGELNATFKVDQNFDFDKLMTQARQYVATTRNRTR